MKAFAGNYAVTFPDGSESLLEIQLGKVSNNAMTEVCKELLLNQKTKNFLLDEKFSFEYYLMILNEGYSLTERENKALLAIHATYCAKKEGFTH